MNLPWGRIAFLGASLGVHLVIVGAVLAVSRTDAPAPLPPIQVDVVQESSGTNRRAFARTLPSIEARVAGKNNRSLPSAPPSRASELAPEPRTRLLPTEERAEGKKNQQDSQSSAREALGFAWSGLKCAACFAAGGFTWKRPGNRWLK